MSFPQVTTHFYEMFVPDEPWHQGSEGWSTSPWPGWGNNPNLVGLPRLAVDGFGADEPPPGTPPAVTPPPAKLGAGTLLLMALAGVGGYYGARACFGQKSFMENRRRRHRR